MKKTRFIPYGYTMRNGRTVIEHGEADIIRYIFDEYIKGASLKDLAEELTARKVPYTEKTEVWDKARIARIIDNAKYTGSEIYDPIIDEDTFEEAAAAKAARLRNQTVSECEGITLMRDRIRCGQCGAPMVRHICSKRYEEAARYATERVQFGKTIGSFQLTQEKIINMAIKIENMRNMVYHYAWMKQNGMSIATESAMAKYYTSRAAFEVVDDAMQIMGGIGYTNDVRIARLWRDCRLSRIMAGTDEIMVHIAGRALLKEFANK